MNSSTSPAIKDYDPVCSRGRRDLNDPFFLKGYQLAWRGDDGASLAIYYVQNDQQGSQENLEDETDGSMMMVSNNQHETTLDEDLGYDQPPSYPCGVLGCSLEFPSIAACEEHYENRHIFQCRECHAILPTDRLLDLHLQEAHDNAFFLASVERGTQGYECLVCTDATFPSIQERLAHLMTEHGYPKWFRFVPQARPVDETIKKKKDKWIKNHEQSSKPAAIIVAEESKMDTSQHDEELFQKKHEQRRERQKQKRAKVPCKFFGKGGCWRSEKCMFLHCSNSTDANMDALAEDMATKVKVTVPDNISFGRKRR